MWMINTHCIIFSYICFFKAVVQNCPIIILLFITIQTVFDHFSLQMNLPPFLLDEEGLITYTQNCLGAPIYYFVKDSMCWLSSVDTKLWEDLLSWNGDLSLRW